MRLLLVFFLAISLLFVQISGLHLHASAEAIQDVHVNHGSHHDAHFSSADSSDGVASEVSSHHHADESDVSLFELGGTAAKVFSFLIFLVVILLVRLPAIRVVFAHRHQTLKLRQSCRWRPPLRAPPLPNF